MTQLLTIGGSALPNPDEYRAEQTPIGHFVRNAEGSMVGDLLGTKARLSVTYSALSAGDYANLAAALAPVFVRARWHDPAAGGFNESDMRASGLSGRCLTRSDGCWWSRVSFTLEER